MHEFFSIISSRLWKGLLPTMKKNYRKMAPFVSKQPAVADIMSIFTSSEALHSKGC